MSRKKKILISLIILGFIIGFSYIQNNFISISEYDLHGNKIPKGFEQYKIVQLSDLHSKSFGKNQGVLRREVAKLNPNLIVFTGDLVDKDHYDEEASLRLMEEMVKIAPVYFVTGNHEWWSGKFNDLEKELHRLGVHVLRNTYDIIQHGQSEITIVGIDDPAGGGSSYDESEITREMLETALQGIEESNQYKILLAHRPEQFSIYAQFNMDLILSGHAHGGQFRVPFVGGVVAPNQGFFPKYTAGTHTLQDSTMMISRGLGNSIIPQRVFNRPEIVVITLHSKE